MAQRVNPVEARKGIFLKSFPIKEFKEMLNYCTDTEAAMRRNSITDKAIVYTKMARWGKGIHNDQWQIFLIQK